MKIQASTYKNKKQETHVRVMMDVTHAQELAKIKGEGVVQEFTSALSKALKT
jgi:hypothetical protein